MGSLVASSQLLLRARTSTHEITQKSRADPAEEKPHKSTPKSPVFQVDGFTGPAHCTSECQGERVAETEGPQQHQFKSASTAIEPHTRLNASHY